MKALSIKQPWSWLIVNGHKDIENRTWYTKFRGKFLIHAGKAPDKTVLTSKVNGIILPNFCYADFGGIVGIAEIVDCVDCIFAPNSPWFSGPYGFVLKNARPLPFMPVRGQLGFFEVDYKGEI